MINNKNKMLPVIPLTDTVIFPDVPTPIISVRDISRKAIEESFNQFDKKIIIATQKNSELDEVTDDKLYRTGVFAEITGMDSISNGVVRCYVLGLETVNIENFTFKNGIIYADFTYMEILEKESKINEGLKNQLIELYKKYIRMNDEISDEIISSIENYKDPESLLHFIVSSSLISVDSKIKILKERNIKNKLKKVIEIFKTEVELFNLQDEINEKVKERLEKNQKQFYLNEQLKVIRKELGKEEDDRIHKLVEKKKNKELPSNVKVRVEDEIERLKKIPTISPEFGVVYNYVEWLLKLPWKESENKNVDLKNTRNILEKNHYGLKDIKERVLEYLSVLKLKDGKVGQILCFVGPPGVGKTSLGISISEALGRPFVRASLGGIRDEAEIRGHRRTYVGAMPGKIIQRMAKAGVKNPIFLLDEVDKIGKDFRGDPASALLEVLDPEVNSEFNDHYIEEGFDLSKVLFITTANTTHTIPPTLLDRMETIKLPGYLEHEKIKIAENYLIPRVLEENGLNNDSINISSTVIKQLVQEYSREAGVRELERLINRLSQKAAKQIVFEGKKKIRIIKTNLKNYLGAPRYKKTQKGKKIRNGVAQGLAVTSNGGEVIQVETRTMKGSGELILTGKLGEVMQESAKAALSLIRSNNGKYDLESDFYKNIDLHIHIPEGAVPKDGPSAGITIFSSILSALTGNKISRNIAMTGEITLSGDILRIGGLREKLVAAQSANISNIILPSENKAELEFFTDEIAGDLNLHFADNVEEIVDYIFS